MSHFKTTRKTVLAYTLAVAASVIGVSAMAWEVPFVGRVSGSGQLIRVQRAVEGFKGVEIDVPAQVEISQGETESLRIETDDNLVELIETVVEKDRLKIRLAKRHRGIRPTSLRIVVQVQMLENLTISGAGNVHVKALRTPRLAARIAGAGDIFLRGIDTEELSLSVAGSGDVIANGRAEHLRISIAGSGDIRTPNLSAKSVKISIAGSGDTTVSASETLKISIAGSGDVGYYGDAAISQSVAGSGRIKKLGTAPPPDVAAAAKN